MLRKSKEQNSLFLFDGKDDLSKVSKDASQIEKESEVSKNKNLDSLREEQKSKRLSGFNPQLSNKSSIISANAGALSDKGGPKKHIKTEISNSIFDNNKISNLANKLDNKEKTKLEKSKIQKNKRIAEQKRMDEMVNKINETNNGKGSDVHRMANETSYSNKYKKPNNGLSIFDSNDFERVPEKTAGEKAAEETRAKRNQKDESWKSNGKSVTAKDIENSFFDNLL